MKKIRVFAVLAAVLILAFNTSIVFAAPPLSLHIVVEETIAGGSETFNATGSAVGSGLICETGSVVEIGGVPSNNPGNLIQTFWVTKQFTCGAGTFDVEMFVRLNTATGYTKANWKIVGGTGLYQNLKGNGKLVGTPSTPGEIIDVYDGKVF